jgi:hypothetical protein
MSRSFRKWNRQQFQDAKAWRQRIHWMKLVYEDQVRVRLTTGETYSASWYGRDGLNFRLWVGSRGDIRQLVEIPMHLISSFELMRNHDIHRVDDPHHQLYYEERPSPQYRVVGAVSGRIHGHGTSEHFVWKSR